MLEKYRNSDQNFPDNLWFIIFIGWFIFTLIFVVIFTSTTPNLVIANESARSFISTSNQIQATILAIVISLTILAVEMTASKYSPRVIEIFKNNVSMWIFLISYMVSIVLGSIFLTFIESPSFPISTTAGTLYLLGVGIFLIFMLIPYVLSTLELLNTERIIKRLADLINIKTINPQIDPFQSIFDVIYGAIRINDFTTMSTGLVSAEERFKTIIKEDPQNRDIDYIASRFFDDIKRCGFLLIEKKEDKYAFETIIRLKTISEWAFSEQYTIVLHRTCFTIEEIGTKACEYGLVSVVDHALTTLKEIVESIEDIEGLAHDTQVTQKWSCLLFSFVESIGNIGKTTVKYNLTSSSGKAVNFLNYLGRIAIEKNLSFDDDFVFKQISSIIIESLYQDRRNSLNSFIQVLELLCIYSVNENRNKEALWILDELKNIGIVCARQKDEHAIQRIVITIRHIAILAMRQEIAEIRKKAIENSSKLQADYPEYFENRYKIQLFDSMDLYPYEEEDLRDTMIREDHELSEYLHRIYDYEG